MGMFGWDLPPGCTMRMIEDQCPDPSPESEEAYEILENAEVNQDVIDRICTIIDRLALQECAECSRRQNEAEAKLEAEMSKAWQEGQY